MLDIERINHIGVRIKEKSRSVIFYELLGFSVASDTGFEEGRPIIMQHPSGIVLNLLGPSTMPDGRNILMDVSAKYTGFTHIALTVRSIEAARKFMEANQIVVTESFSFGEMSAIFIRDPDRNVIELDAYGQNEEEGVNSQ